MARLEKKKLDHFVPIIKTRQLFLLLDLLFALWKPAEKEPARQGKFYLLSAAL